MSAPYACCSSAICPGLDWVVSGGGGGGVRATRRRRTTSPTPAAAAATASVQRAWENNWREAMAQVYVTAVAAQPT
jgi:hypothetical protein